MKTILQIVNDIKKIKSEKNSFKLIKYLLAIDNQYLPSSIMLDKARAIQLSEENTFSLEDAKEILEMIISTDPDYIPAYIEMGYFQDAVMDDPENALVYFDRGISKTQRLLEELLAGRNELLSSKDKDENVQE